jgi:hypothetical protein
MMLIPPWIARLASYCRVARRKRVAESCLTSRSHPGIGARGSATRRPLALPPERSSCTLAVTTVRDGVQAAGRETPRIDTPTSCMEGMETMPHISLMLWASAAVATLLPSCAAGQAAPPAAASLENVTSCVIEGADVFVGTGKGPDARRYRYPWDAAIDALCNANGFAIAAPPKLVSTPGPSALGAAPASTQASDRFPAGARRLEADELTQLVSGHVVKTFTLEGGTAGTRVQYEGNGVVYLNAGGGALSGRWRVEGSAVCYKWNGGQVPDGCVEVRVVGDRTYAKRATGEIVRLETGK